MKLPLSWLNEFVKVDDIDPKELAEKLTRSGLQVESIETIGPEPLSDFFVVGEVLESVVAVSEVADEAILIVVYVVKISDHLEILCRAAEDVEEFIDVKLVDLDAVIIVGDGYRGLAFDLGALVLVVIADIVGRKFKEIVEFAGFQKVNKLFNFGFLAGNFDIKK